MARVKEVDALELEAKKLGYDLLEGKLSESLEAADRPVKAVLMDQIKEVQKRSKELET